MRAVTKLATIAILVMISGCAAPAQMTAGPQVLGAEGEVKAAAGANGNTQVKIVIRHLADPEKIKPGATVYVAWIQPKDGGLPQNAGQIQLTNNQEGQLDTITPFRSFRVTVTAEQTATATSPSSNSVLTTDIVDGK